MRTYFLLLLASALAWTAPAQTTNDWLSVDAGGGASTSAVYSARCTIGQPDAGKSTSANYTIIGGFWAVASRVTADAPPTLLIERAGPNAVLSWPSPSTGYVLQSNPVLTNPAGWTDVGSVPADNGLRKSVVVAPASSALFFRLRRL